MISQDIQNQISVLPVAYYPSVLAGQDSIVRYFCCPYDRSNIMEIAMDNYKDLLQNPYYKCTSLYWYVSGSKNDILDVAGQTIATGTIEKNRAAVAIAERAVPSMKYRLSNLEELHIDNNQLYTASLDTALDIENYFYAQCIALGLPICPLDNDWNIPSYLQSDYARFYPFMQRSFGQAYFFDSNGNELSLIGLKSGGRIKNSATGNYLYALKATALDAATIDGVFDLVDSVVGILAPRFIYQRGNTYVGFWVFQAARPYPGFYTANLNNAATIEFVGNDQVIPLLPSATGTNYYSNPSAFVIPDPVAPAQVVEFITSLADGAGIDVRTGTSAAKNDKMAISWRDRYVTGSSVSIYARNIAQDYSAYIGTFIPSTELQRQTMEWEVPSSAPDSVDIIVYNTSASYLYGVSAGVEIQDPYVQVTSPVCPALLELSSSADIHWTTNFANYPVRNIFVQTADGASAKFYLPSTGSWSAQGNFKHGVTTWTPWIDTPVSANGQYYFGLEFDNAPVNELVSDNTLALQHVSGKLQVLPIQDRSQGIVGCYDVPLFNRRFAKNSMAVEIASVHNNKQVLAPYIFPMNDDAAPVFRLPVSAFALANYYNYTLQLNVLYYNNGEVSQRWLCDEAVIWPYFKRFYDRIDQPPIRPIESGSITITEGLNYGYIIHWKGYTAYTGIDEWYYQTQLSPNGAVDYDYDKLLVAKSYASSSHYHYEAVITPQNSRINSAGNYRWFINPQHESAEGLLPVTSTLDYVDHSITGRYAMVYRPHIHFFTGSNSLSFFADISFAGTGTKLFAHHYGVALGTVNMSNQFFHTSDTNYSVLYATASAGYGYEMCPSTASLLAVSEYLSPALFAAIQNRQAENIAIGMNCYAGEAFTGVVISDPVQIVFDF